MGIGRIKGGLARNVIADQCVVDWELRPVVPEDGEFVKEEYYSEGGLKEFVTFLVVFAPF